MERRALGRSGLTVAPLCFGGNVFGWTADEATSFRLLDAFVDAGFDFIDTADVYSAWAPGNAGGESETIIGNWMKSRGNRDRIVLATKVGSEMGPGRKGLSPAYIRSAVEASLKRLQTDRIDLYQSHWDDPSTPFEETLGAYKELIDQGKVRAVGASNLTAARLREALEVSARSGLPRYETLQPEYNLFDRQGYEAELEGLCRDNGLGVISYYSLASGFLTGKYRSAADAGKSARGQGVVSKYLNDRGRAILAALDEVAGRHGATPAQVALAWLIARPGLTAPIASASKPEQMGDLVAAVRLRLEPGDIARLDAASAWR
ncbi:aldo/keto reductase [Azospirillum picis]|uniref:Aryl-alcohol dehydrogenase-like predicted oxidoreductase n=1 Tax=Azospirillum picis TaxID=488438 RepID=A0ABU0MCT1_9PROT|nr:aldo/keto reductase [Azospirillum picis]MBP2297763.1 aryl-alcohol dehydrogenase-like predicted oxidoreductase [Azospirillum picis]MDQ0531214.1 aryl-alcohol dehydrogenase-like predicted oxidoreductase [Azospirillum picis]